MPKARKNAELVLEAEPGQAYYGRQYYLRPTGVEMALRVGASHRSDASSYGLIMYSSDNGRTWTEPEPIETAFVDENGDYHSSSMDGAYFDPNNGAIMEFGGESRQDKEVVLTHLKYTRPIYRISFDDRKTWTDKRYVIEDGDDYDHEHWAEGITYGKRMAVGMPPRRLSGGMWIMPYYTAPLNDDGTDFFNPYGAYGHFNCGVFQGVWNDVGDDLLWTKGAEVHIDPAKSSRGLSECDVTELPDGRLVMAGRGSNQKIPEAKGVKWLMLSDDRGLTWSQPAELTYDDGSTMYSPATYLEFIHHSNGKVYLATNIVDENPNANWPRHPLNLAEFDEQSLTVKKDTVRVIADREECDHERIQFSNFCWYEDRENGDLAFLMAAMPEVDYDDWTSHLYRFRLSMEH